MAESILLDLVQQQVQLFWKGNGHSPAATAVAEPFRILRRVVVFGVVGIIFVVGVIAVIVLHVVASVVLGREAELGFVFSLFAQCLFLGTFLRGSLDAVAIASGAIIPCRIVAAGGGLQGITVAARVESTLTPVPRTGKIRNLGDILHHGWDFGQASSAVEGIQRR